MAAPMSAPILGRSLPVSARAKGLLRRALAAAKREGYVVPQIRLSFHESILWRGDLQQGLTIGLGGNRWAVYMEPCECVHCMDETLVHEVAHAVAGAVCEGMQGHRGLWKSIYGDIYARLWDEGGR